MSIRKVILDGFELTTTKMLFQLARSKVRAGSEKQDEHVLVRFKADEGLAARTKCKQFWRNSGEAQSDRSNRSPEFQHGSQYPKLKSKQKMLHNEEACSTETWEIITPVLLNSLQGTRVKRLDTLRTSFR